MRELIVLNFMLVCFSEEINYLFASFFLAKISYTCDTNLWNVSRQCIYIVVSRIWQFCCGNLGYWVLIKRLTDNVMSIGLGTCGLLFVEIL